MFESSILHRGTVRISAAVTCGFVVIAAMFGAVATTLPGATATGTTTSVVADGPPPPGHGSDSWAW